MCADGYACPYLFAGNSGALWVNQTNYMVINPTVGETLSRKIPAA